MKALLHQRGMIALPWGGSARTSYPVLPWIGVIAAGYALGPLYQRAVSAGIRLRDLVTLSAAALALFLNLRGINGYGERVPWQMDGGPMTILSFVNLTKYPPSADFLLLTLGVGLALLAAFERMPRASLAWLSILGGAPLFSYLLHLGLLRLIHEAALGFGFAGLSGRMQVDSPWQIWLIAVASSVTPWAACRWMVGVKRRAPMSLLKYL